MAELTPRTKLTAIAGDLTITLKRGLVVLGTIGYAKRVNGEGWIAIPHTTTRKPSRKLWESAEACAYATWGAEARDVVRLELAIAHASGVVAEVKDRMERFTRAIDQGDIAALHQVAREMSGITYGDMLKAQAAAKRNQNKQR